MFIEIKDLETQPIDFREEFSPGAIDLGPDLQQRSLLHTEGRADLVEAVESGLGHTGGFRRGDGRG